MPSAATAIDFSSRGMEVGAEWLFDPDSRPLGATMESSLDSGCTRLRPEAEVTG
jgi:hypothetical protein